LKDLTGVAAVLFFQLPGLDDIEEPSDSDSDAEEEKKEESSEEESDASASQGGWDEQQLELLINEGMLNDEYQIGDEGHDAPW